MKKSHVAGLLSALFATITAHAFEPFVVKDIRVEGVQRTEAGTVFSYLPVKVGETMTDEKAAQAIKALFGTGFYRDVRLEIEGSVLVVLVDERSAIASVDFIGIKAFDKELLRKSLKEVGLAESRIFDRSLLDKAEQEIKRQYLSRGYYGAKVVTTAAPQERNRVALSFTVEEGEISRIKQINIIGNKAFDEAELLKIFSLTTPGLMTWYTKNDQYSKQKLSADLESLRSFYLDRGYLEFNSESTQVSISPDKKDIYITVNIFEGEKYTVASVKLAGTLLLPQAVLAPLVTLRPGDVYSRERLTDSTKAISERLGDEGYAFANVNAAPELDKVKHQVAFTLLVDPGRRVYVRRINISGNTRTRDEVIRREMRQMEASWYDGDKINKSRTRVDKIGYFEEVTVETPAVAGTTDQVDVNVTVKEKPTGSVTIGAGFSQSEKLVLSGAIQQQNIFGSGKSVGAQISTSKSNQVLSLSYTDPYYTVDGMSRGFDIYRRKTDTSKLNTIAAYDVTSWGGGVRYGIPIGEENGIGVGLSVDSTSIALTPFSPLFYQDFVSANGNRFTSLVGNVGWSQDTVDSRIWPTKGVVQNVSVEIGLPGGNLKYVRPSYQYERFFPLTRNFTLMMNGQVDIGNGFGGKQLPFWKNYYAGGIGSVRGYENGSLGPRDPSFNDNAIGGNRRLIGNAELLFPIPGLPRSVRMSAFFDAGNVWGYGSHASLGDLRYSTGLSVSWTSPFGPLKFSFADPLRTRENDKVQHFQFQLGNAF
jgi:outer membrane protein insertion porin family